MNLPLLPRALAGLALLLISALAMAGNLNFNGGPVTNCTLSGHTYSCAALTLPNYNDAVTIASGYAVNVNGPVALTYNQGLTMSGSAALTSNGNMNIGNIATSLLNISGGTLTANGGSFTVGEQNQTIVANITAASINIGNGSTVKVTGSLTSSGPVALGSHSTVVGPISGSVISTTSPVVISGDVNASVSFTLASGSVMTGNLIAPVVTLQPSPAVVNGNVTAMTSLTLGSGDSVNGNVVGGNVTLQDSEAYITGTALVNAITLGYHGRVNQTIACRAFIPASPCSCVSNNSGYAVGDPNYPRCAPPAVPPPSSPDHFQITHSGSALTCTPQTVTVTACANSSCSALYTGGTTVTLTPGNASFAIGSSGVNSAATVQQLTAGVGKLSAGANTTCTNTGTMVGSDACNMNFSGQGFQLQMNNQLSGVPTGFTIAALKAAAPNQSCVPLFANSTQNVTLSCGYANPAAGTLPVSVNNVPLAASAGAACSAAGKSVPLTFDQNGVASPVMSYPDVGQLNLNASTAGGSGASVTGSGNVIVAPHHFALVAPNNPGAADANGGVFIKAGAPFSATVTAANVNNLATPNFGQEAPPESVALTSSLVLPAGGNNPALGAGSVGPFAGGVATVSALSWGEVGIIQLAAQLANPAGYLGSGLKATPGVNGNLGRFVPDHFDTSLALATPMACAAPLNCAAGNPTSVAYSQQPIPLTVTARNAAGVAVQNYSGGAANAALNFAKPVTLTAWHAAGSTLLANPPAAPGGNSVVNGAVPAAAFSAGVAQSTASAYKFGAVSLPTPVFWRATDSDGVTSLLASGSTEAGVTVVSGQLQLPNNYGSELLPMTVNLRAQLYSPAGIWVSNVADDGITTFQPADVALSNCTKALGKGGACIASVALLNTAPITFYKGQAQFRLQAPGAGLSGSVQMRLNSIPYLPMPASAPYGLGVFGLYKSGPVLYLREVY